MTEADQLKLERRIRNQRARLRYFEELEGGREHHYRVMALSYRKQLIDAGQIPKIQMPVVIGLHKLKTRETQ